MKDHELKTIKTQLTDAAHLVAGPFDIINTRKKAASNLGKAISNATAALNNAIGLVDAEIKARKGESDPDPEIDLDK